MAQRHAAQLARAMINGEWKFNNTSIGFFKDGHLADGQHRLSACIDAEYTFKTLVVPSLGNDAMLTVDQQTKARTISVILDMEGVDEPEVKSYIASNYLKSFIIGHFSGGNKSSNTALKVFVNNFDEPLSKVIEEAKGILKQSTNRIYSLKSASLWLFYADKKNPSYKKEARRALTEITTGVSEFDDSPGMVANKVLLKKLKKQGPSITMNNRIGTTIKALNYIIAGQTATPKAVAFPAKKRERFPQFV